MSTIVTRAGKGSPLTHNEVDANFDNLNTDKAEVGSANTFTAAQTISNQLNLTNASNYNLYASGAGSNYMAGSLLLGTTSSTSRLINQLNITGATTSYGYMGNGVILSDVTTQGIYYATLGNTQASAFTLATMIHFSAGQSTIGATSAVTNQYGFSAGSTLTGATNNYGFRGILASATGVYNLYMSGTADNYLAGSLGIGAVPVAGQNFRVNKSVTGAITSYGLVVQGSIQSDVTTTGIGIYSGLGTAASAFTLATLNHFQVTQGTIGATSTVTNQNGYLANVLTGATNNYGFRGLVAAATGAWNLYMNGTANNYMAGSLGIASTTLTDRSLHIQKTITGATTAYGVVSNGTVQSDVTAAATGYRNVLNTQAASFTLNTYTHFTAAQNSIGASSVLLNQIGFSVDSGCTGATNNYSFYGNIPAATGRYNLYMAGTAVNYFAGAILQNQTGTFQYNHYTPAMPLQITTTAATGVQLANFSADQFGAAYLITKSRSATAGTNTIVQNGDALGNIIFCAADGTNYLSAATIQALVDGSPSTNDMPTRLVFSTTADGASSPTERMRIDNAGGVGIGATAEAYTKFSVGGIYPTNSASTQIVRAAGVIPSGTTSGAWTFLSAASTQAASFTLGSWYHFSADPAAFGASSAVTSQYGFIANSGMTGATNNYGFYGNIAAATGRYNLYMNGTADNYLAGRIGVGVLAAGFTLMQLGGSSKTPSFGISTTQYFNPTAQSDVTDFRLSDYNPATAAASFTVGNLQNIVINDAVIGAGSAITSQYGVRVNPLTGSTNSYAYYGGIAAATGRWNLFMGGTAQNYLAGILMIGTTTPLGMLNVSGGNINNTTTASGATGYYINNGTTYNGFSSDYSANVTYLDTNQNFNIRDAQNSYATRFSITSGNITVGGNFLVNGVGGLGYGTGSGGAVTQGTSRTTGVTLNKTNGAITLFSAAGSATYQSFTVTNSTVAATDTVIVVQKSGTDLYEMMVTAVAAGSFRITYRTTGGTTTEQPVFNFAVIKAVAA
jgi:hypothetical protein